MTVECPTCSDSFDSETGMKVHHAKVHDESISGFEYDCAWCGESVRRKQREYEKAFCSDECRDSWQSKNRSGENNPAYRGASITLECEWCGGDYEEWETRRERSRFCSRDCAGEWKSENLIGEDAPAYTGYSENYGDGWIRQRRRARKKYDGVCQQCGVEQSDRKHDVHHIIPVSEFDNPEDAHDLENLTLLCRPCHQTVEYEMDVEEQKDRLK